MNNTEDIIDSRDVIARSYFVEYCEEMVKDIGDLPRNIPSYLEIDWQKTADNLEADYMSVDFGGNEYLIAHALARAAPQQTDQANFRTQHQIACDMIANELASDNARFDRTRFLTAANYECK